MKKLVAAACALAAGIVLADAEAPSVSSANIVGYTEVTLTQKNTILGVNFTAVDGTALTLQDAVPYVEGMTKSNSDTKADQIQIQNASGTYDIYYMSNGYNAKGNKYTAANDEKWCVAGSTTLSAATLPLGAAFWFVRKDTTNPLTVKIAGGVSLLASNDTGIDGAYKLFANPYPADLPLNDGIPYVAGMTKSNSDTKADQIQVQNASGTYDIYYMSNGYNAKGNKYTVANDEKWCVAGTTTKATASIAAGQGAWFVRKGDTDFDIPIVRPFNVE